MFPSLSLGEKHKDKNHWLLHVKSLPVNTLLGIFAGKEEVLIRKPSWKEVTSALHSRGGCEDEEPFSPPQWLL